MTRDGDYVTLTAEAGMQTYVRPAGYDFKAGFTHHPKHPLTPSDIALLAAMNQPSLTVTRRPDVAVIATGDELVQPGEVPGPDQITASNSYGLCAYIEGLGGGARLLPTVRDRVSSLIQAFEMAKGADLIVTIGGASVGDHDLVGSTAAAQGLERSFYKVAMRPGKPLMAGRLGDAALIGLPGNPVSAMVCGRVFLKPMIHRMLGLPVDEPLHTATLTHDLAQGGPRAHYMRAQVTGGMMTVHAQQDSSLLHVLTASNALAVQPPHAPPRKAGEAVPFMFI